MMGWGGVSEQGWRKGPWTPEEDKLLNEYVSLHGEGRWSSVSKCSGLLRSGKSCRLRWVNYLRPGLKRGHITPQEEGIIIELHALWGNKWSIIARYLPGRTDNEIKNYWRTHFKKKGKAAAVSASVDGADVKQEKRKFHRQRNRKPAGEDAGMLLWQETASASLSPHSEVTAGDPISKMITSVRPETEPQQQQQQQPQQKEEVERLSTYTVDVGNQCFFPATYNNEISAWPPQSSDTINNIPVEGLWGLLWNLDDQINWRGGGGGGGQTGDLSRTVFHNQANVINDNGECIF